MLEVKHISMRYKGEQEDGYILHDLNFKIKKNECLAVVGGSGCGKTTLLNIISGLLIPSEGEVLFDGRKVNSVSSRIAVVSQEYGLLPWKTVGKNIILPLKLKKKNDKYEMAKDMIRLLELDHVTNSYPSQLSGGQKQRAAIVRALLSFPDLILMDEPFSALDPVLRERLYVEIRNYLKQKTITSVIVTHSMKEAVYFGDKILVFSSDPESSPHLIENKFAGLTGNNSVLEMRKQIQIAMIGGAEI